MVAWTTSKRTGKATIFCDQIDILIGHWVAYSCATFGVAQYTNSQLFLMPIRAAPVVTRPTMQALGSQ